MKLKIKHLMQREMIISKLKRKKRRQMKRKNMNKSWKDFYLPFPALPAVNKMPWISAQPFWLTI